MTVFASVFWIVLLSGFAMPVVSQQVHSYMVKFVPAGNDVALPAQSYTSVKHVVFSHPGGVGGQESDDNIAAIPARNNIEKPPNTGRFCSDFDIVKLTM